MLEVSFVRYKHLVHGISVSCSLYYIVPCFSRWIGRSVAIYRPISSITKLNLKIMDDVCICAGIVRQRRCARRDSGDDLSECLQQLATYDATFVRSLLPKGSLKTTNIRSNLWMFQGKNLRIYDLHFSTRSFIHI